ncbi:DUF3817 domain-containing protein [Sorangium sp. So ce131]|uniref:DUF3817 domain-containing protein n=1 Tax=Sorangium sp. So ce131 TaxID=3133282 RepID=UPI003F5DF012
MNERRTLRLVSLIEGVSLLMLLLVAMPLKYALGYPVAVRIAGSVHGVLFLAMLSAAFRAALERSLSSRAVLRVLALSVVPFGFVLADRILRGGAEPERS